jgi:hypothetical protein
MQFQNIAAKFRAPECRVLVKSKFGSCPVGPLGQQRPYRRRESATETSALG